MATIFTVHGTFASGPEHGEKWWQKGSEFEEELRKNVASTDGYIVFQPVPWSGDNSEMARREGAEKLARVLSGSDATDERSAIIAHSHGGAVVTSGCINHMAVSALKNVSRVVTVATPYLQFRKSRWIFNRVGFLAKALLASSFLVALLVSATLVYLGAFTNIALVADFLAATIPFVMIYVLVLVMDLLRFKGMRASFVSPRANIIASNWTCLYDKNDEAVFGLASLDKFKPVLFPKRFAVPLISAASVFAVPLTMLFFALSPSLMLYLDSLVSYPSITLLDKGTHSVQNLWYLYHLPSSLLPPFRMSSEDNAFLLWFAPSLFAVVVVGFVSFALTWLVVNLSPFLSRLAARALDAVTARAIKETLYGNDTLGENVCGAKVHPSWMKGQFRPLPEQLSSELNAFCDAEAAKSLPRLRALIHNLTFVYGNPKEAIAPYLTWNELVHTSYFAIPRFRKLVYYSIANSEGFKPTQAFLDDPDYALVARWYQEIQPAAQSPAPPSAAAGVTSLLRRLSGLWKRAPGSAEG
jgi:hypothetical protein